MYKPEDEQLDGVTVRCRECAQLRLQNDELRDRIGELELRLEGAGERAAAAN
jgi:hypothetical protein